MNTSQIEQVRRESARWVILLAIQAGQEIGTTDEMTLSVVRGAWPDIKRKFVRTQLDYLEGKGLVTVERPPVRPWSAKLTARGHDVVDYTVDCEAGIDRPPKDS